MAASRNHVLCSKSELDYYKKPVVQQAVENTYEVQVLPRNSLLPSNPICFFVEGSVDFVDLSRTRLSVTVQILAEDGTGVKDADKCALVNNSMSSLFASAQVSLKNSVISHSDFNYPYRAFLETALNYSNDVKTYRLSGQGYIQDQPSKFDSQENFGYKGRKLQTLEGNAFEYVGPLHVDVCSQHLLLPSMLDFSVTLTPSRQEFALQNFDHATKPFRYVITDAKLLVTKVKLYAPAAVLFEQTIAKSPARMPIEYVKINTLSVPAGVKSHARDNIFHGNLPEKVIIGLVSNQRYAGNFGTSPFCFAHHYLNFIQLKVNGRSVPTLPLRPDYEAGNITHAYNTLLDGSGCEGNHDIGVDLNLYGNGLALYVFNTSPEGLGGCSHETLAVQGNIGLELGFAKDTAQTLTLIVYSQTKSSISIDRYRNVTTTAT